MGVQNRIFVPDFLDSLTKYFGCLKKRLTPNLAQFQRAEVEPDPVEISTIFRKYYCIYGGKFRHFTILRMLEGRVMLFPCVSTLARFYDSVWRKALLINQKQSYNTENCKLANFIEIASLERWRYNAQTKYIPHWNWRPRGGTKLKSS